MADATITALVEENGRVHIITLVDESVKIKGIGVFNPKTTMNDVKFGQEVQIGSKIFRHLPPRLPELIQGMKRRAQTIGSKDAGVLITRLGIGPGDVVLEAGLGSGVNPCTFQEFSEHPAISSLSNQGKNTQKLGLRTCKRSLKPCRNSRCIRTFMDELNPT